MSVLGCLCQWLLRCDCMQAKHHLILWLYAPQAALLCNVSELWSHRQSIGVAWLVLASGHHLGHMLDHIHSWLHVQAMDRAHRMGQRRAVSVFRLLVEGSLEQRILGLQRFKLDVATAVVGADSMAQSSLDGSHLLDVLAGPQVRLSWPPVGRCMASGRVLDVSMAGRM